MLLVVGDASCSLRGRARGGYGRASRPMVLRYTAGSEGNTGREPRAGPAHPAREAVRRCRDGIPRGDSGGRLRNQGRPAVVGGRGRGIADGGTCRLDRGADRPSARHPKRGPGAGGARPGRCCWYSRAPRGRYAASPGGTGPPDRRLRSRAREVGGTPSGGRYDLVDARAPAVTRRDDDQTRGAPSRLVRLVAGARGGHAGPNAAPGNTQGQAEE